MFSSFEFSDADEQSRYLGYSMWFSSRPGKSLYILASCTTHTCYSHGSQVLREINNSWVPVNMQGLQIAREESCGQCVWMMCSLWDVWSCDKDEEGVIHHASELMHNGIKNSDGIIRGGDKGGTGKQGHKQAQKNGERKEGRKRDHKRLIRFYRLTRLKSCLLFSKMPGGVWSCV